MNGNSEANQTSKKPRGAESVGVEDSKSDSKPNESEGQAPSDVQDRRLHALVKSHADCARCGCFPCVMSGKKIIARLLLDLDNALHIYLHSCDTDMCLQDRSWVPERLFKGSRNNSRSFIDNFRHIMDSLLRCSLQQAYFCRNMIPFCFLHIILIGV